ncbi:type II secretion system protein [Chengkuizengella axinellae]|uniref:Type II secretion system protein n=1 Tax=Chengkuizengella axinellae TaxID=3064388 RepID=A0ABT9IY53_9BACL|nr:type II secretion system protein [Chengkuizengella sp. 2205SS18-9]MDP5274297.1 type II secretion system protein [Chengkuizengella sp. 2205SS18-9]
MKWIKKNEGFTLVELLAGIVLISVIATLGIMLFYSSHLFWENSIEKYSNDANAELTMTTISKYVTDSIDIFTKNNNLYTEEVRVKTGEGSGNYHYKSFKFENGYLILYELNISDEAFHSDDLSDTVYTSEMLLADKVEDFQVSKSGNLIDFTVEFEHVIKNTSIKLFEF